MDSMLNKIEIPNEFFELSERYGPKFNKNLLKFLKRVASEEYVRLNNKVLNTAFCPTYHLGKNPAKGKEHIVDWARKSTYFKNNTSTRFENLLQEDNSVVMELLFLGVVWRDDYTERVKSYDYNFRNYQHPALFKLAVELNEKDMNIDSIEIKEAETDYVPLLNTYSDSLGMDVEPTELVEKAVKCLQHTEIPTSKVLSKLITTTRRDLCSEYKDLYSRDNKLLLKNNFKLSYTGRIFVTGRGFSTVSIKSANKGNFYDTLYGAGNYHNYDIDASQLSLIPQLAEGLGLTKNDYEEPIKTVKELLDNSKEVLNISRGLMKQCLYSIMFSTPGRNLNCFSSSHTHIKREFIELGLSEQDAKDKANFIIPKLSGRLLKFVALLDKIKNRLDEKLIKEQPEYIENKVTKINYKLFFESLKDHNDNRKGKLLSLFMQSSEAAFLYHLIILCADNGITTLSSEYDGVVTDKPIPEELFEQSRVLSGEKNISVSEKPFDKSGERK